MDIDALNDMMRAFVPLYQHMDVRVGVEGDRFFARLPFEDNVKGHVGTVHAAFQWAAGELLGGVVALQTFGGLEDVFLVVRKVSIEFVRPAKSAISAETVFDAAAQEKLRTDLSAGEVTLSLPVEVKNEAGTVVATLNCEYLMRPARKKDA